MLISYVLLLSLVVWLVYCRLSERINDLFECDTILFRRLKRLETKFLDLEKFID